MKGATAIRNKKNISILFIAHTIKLKDNQPLNKYDIAGAGMIHNTIENVIMIGKSSLDENLTYIKHEKCRNARKKDKVMVIETNEDQWLHFDYVRFDYEKNLIQINQMMEEKRNTKLIEIAENIFGDNSLSYSEIKRKYAELYKQSEENEKKKIKTLENLNIIIYDPETKKYMINRNEVEL